MTLWIIGRKRHCFQPTARTRGIVIRMDSDLQIEQKTTELIGRRQTLSSFPCKWDRGSKEEEKRKRIKPTCPFAKADGNQRSEEKRANEPNALLERKSKERDGVS